MPSHPIDFEVFGGSVASPQFRDIFSEKRRIQRWLEIEIALAQVQAELGVIPREAAAEITNKATLDKIDLLKVRENYLEARHSLVPLLKVLKTICAGEAGQYVHYGATTQDILDTAEILEAKEALQIIYPSLRKLENTLLLLAEKHAATPMIGRTHGQQALPITFGFKVSVWLAEIRRHIRRLQESCPRFFCGQLSGGVGTFSAFGDQAQQVSRLTLERLGLRFPLISWHSSRDNIAEMANILALIGGTLGKIANEIYLLQKTEFSELAEPSGKSIGSSTMPHKTNPTRCQKVVSLAWQIRNLASLVSECTIHEHERDVRCLNTEWDTLPSIFIYCGTALNHMNEVCSGLYVDTGHMLKNLHLQADMIQTEWLLFHLAPTLGKMRAHEKIHHLVALSKQTNQSLKEIILADREISPLMSENDILALDQPEKYLGLAPKIVRDVIEYNLKERAVDLPCLA